MDRLQNIEGISPDTQDKIDQLAAYIKPGLEGVEGFDDTRPRIQSIKIVQNISANNPEVPSDAKPGDLYTPLGNLGTSVDFIPIFAYMGRTKFDDDFRLDCTSLDKKTGSKYFV